MLDWLPLGKGHTATERSARTGDEILGSSISVLSVSPLAEDHELLEGLFSDHSSWTPYAHLTWKLYKSYRMTSAMAELQRNPVSIVLCECDLEPDTWKHILTVSVFLPTQPLLLVTSERADEGLWMEAVECGAYDVLAKPFNIHELTRTVIFAWLRWNGQYSASLPSIAGAYGI